jgi:tight adherence protein C
MSPISYAIIAFAIVGGVACLAGAFLLRRWAPVPQERFQATAAEVLPASILRWEERAKAGWQRTLERLSRVFGPRDRAKASRVRQRLAWAGYHDPRAFRYFIGAKGACAILSGYAYVLYGLSTHRALPYILPISIILTVLGFFLPDLWLRNRIQARQRQILHALPDALDLLMVCVEAGMGFDAAVGRVTERPETQRSPLHQEMLRMHLEVRVGRPREEALHAFGERTGVEEVKSVVAAFIQTERLGTSLGGALRVHAESARVKRRRRAEEQAHMAPIKMIFPTVIFLMPVFFLVTLAPALLRLLEALQAIH